MCKALKKGGTDESIQEKLLKKLDKKTSEKDKDECDRPIFLIESEKVFKELSKKKSRIRWPAGRILCHLLGIIKK